MADVATAFYVSDGVIYEIRVKVRDFEEAVVVKTSDSHTVAVGTTLGKHQWFVIIDSANIRAIKQKDDELKDLRQEVADLEHTASRIPGRVHETSLRERKEALSSLTTLVENMKYKGPSVIRLRGV